MHDQINNLLEAPEATLEPLQQQCHLCETTSRIIVTWGAQIDDNLKETSYKLILKNCVANAKFEKSSVLDTNTDPYLITSLLESTIYIYIYIGTVSLGINDTWGYKREKR